MGSKVLVNPFSDDDFVIFSWGVVIFGLVCNVLPVRHGLLHRVVADRLH